MYYTLSEKPPALTSTRIISDPLTLFFQPGKGFPANKSEWGKMNFGSF
jgi:hypothetical protein